MPEGGSAKDGKYYVVEDEATIVRLIFERQASRIGYKRIANEVNLLGARTRRDNKFTQGSIHDILPNENHAVV